MAPETAYISVRHRSKAQRMSRGSDRQDQPVPLQTTISDDRSRGSEFDSEHRILSALKQPALKEPAVKQPTDFINPPIKINNRIYNPHSSDDESDDDRPERDSSEFEEDTGAKLRGRHDKIHTSTPSTFRTERNKNHVDSNAFMSENISLDNALHKLASALNIQDGPKLTMETLRDYMLDLKQKEKAPKIQLIYRVFQPGKDRSVKKHMYLDQPLWLEGELSSREALVGNLPLNNISSYLSKHPEVCGILYRDYDVASILNTEPLDEEWDTKVKPKYTSEKVELVTASLTTAYSKFLDYYSFNVEGIIPAESVELRVPYIAIYYTRGDVLNPFLELLESKQRATFQALKNCIVSQYENEYNVVDGMIRRGTITQTYIKYLFKPGDVIIQGKGESSSGYMCKSWLDEDKTDQDQSSDGFIDKPLIPTNIQTRTKFSMSAWRWTFDSEFSREIQTLALSFDANSEMEISDLGIRPFRFVDEPTKVRLRSRGEWFWKCRMRRIVSYHGTPDGFSYSSDERYIVDLAMYRELHKSPLYNNASRPQFIGAEAMQREHPPDGNFIYLAPPTTKGYNLKRKNWVDLQLDGLREVSWNTQAFESLVIKEKTKRLIQALISNQIEAEKATDLISGKGNGLILLLHGGPGTGKTLTAESVAEIAKKPLYPVTCGDIGTKPEDVEKYLESVLYLGKTWGCVVLLDEADVFLEQRSLEDLHRNALVSVFLRVLEYYDGILILTSNRVGTFDEAFKSRIQLAVHYGSLTTHQRTKIWGNFIERLENMKEEGIDFVNLKDNIEHLSSKQMNGREIRNAITTARQYARWERQQDRNFKLNYKVLKEVIEMAGEFDEYINTLNGGLTQEQLAKEEGLR
ncbi:AAA family ATPase [Trichoderma chlorosporum]